MQRKNSRSRGTVQAPAATGASVIPLRRVTGSQTGVDAARRPGREPSALDEGMAALANLLAEAWAV